MNKTQKLIISILLILAAIVIQFLLKESNTNLNEELISFLSGFCFAGGIFMFFSTYSKKKV